MAEPFPTFSLSLHPSIDTIDPVEWDACGGGDNRHSGDSTDPGTPPKPKLS